MEYVLGIDLVSFEALYKSCERLHARLMIESSKLAIATSQGTEDDVNARLEVYQNQMLDKKELGAADLMRKVGKGF